MRKVLLAMLAATMMLLVGCGKKEVCTVDGCTQEVYKDGLCADHYVEEAMATPAPTATPEPTIVDGLKDGYQDYIDTAIRKTVNVLKNPYSMVINNIYVWDATEDYGHTTVHVYLDIMADNSYGGSVRSCFMYDVYSTYDSFVECTSNTEKQLFTSIVEICTGQRSEQEETKIEEGYYERHGQYYLHVPAEWYADFEPTV